MSIKLIPDSILRLGGRRGRRGGLRVSGPQRGNWYVDSVAGDDGNDGQSQSTAFRTLAAVQSVVGADEIINLKRGSTWREQLFLTRDNVVVQAYGTGDRPIIDARDPIGAGAWSKTGGYTNVYQANVTFEEIVIVGTTVRLFEDGILLTLAANLSAVDATAGTYYIASHTDPSQSISMHQIAATQQ
jgi:hypothetical protein